ncbi:cellulase (glycosyl hydrolase family 5) subfamily protein [Chrysochromulina tobinii]|uniref:Cellulase (Glycosyl hydrolase family 5) subfamily protein n=1 Tax=Chrysochromulina tobinii TaxID=1460289 RepID=A0A0M0LQS8_9EUKA|nr:cellulase (glycosyl hydrolase family 5) subfamily protein [Chrysochromulina tobinii]|eukprot:KOO53394.1 cellulase (glycosyl hydrolase family 5) subfamily protein [Chrysochromulina sp. CCMP291]
MPRILQEVLAFAPDVLLLQEVDLTWYEQFWKPAMEGRGYVGKHTLKRGRGSSEGIASFALADAFEIVEIRELSLSLDRPDLPVPLARLLGAHTSTRDAEIPTVAQLLLLREAAPVASPTAVPRQVLVANTHLYFANEAMHVRTMQTALILDGLREWSDELQPQQQEERQRAIGALAASAPALIVAGDLNADASDAALQLLTSGLVRADDPDWLHGALNWAPSLELPAAARESAFELAAALIDCVDERYNAVQGSDVEAAWAEHLRHSDAARRGAHEEATLEGAQRIAREFHLLRKAVQLPSSARSRAHKLRADARDDASARDGANELERFAAAVVRDAAAGRTLLESEALAAAEPDGVHAANSLRSDRFHIRGLSWFGAEGAGAAPDGLWQRKASDLIGIVARLGFNALRLPLAVDHVLSNPSINRWTLTANPELQRLRHLDLLERIVRLAAAQGLLVMLDMHRLRASVWPTTHGLWYDEGMPATQLESAWRRLARTFCSHWNVFAADLFNEPWGASWGDGDQERDWALYAGRLGSLVLEECPRWLILVEGLGVGSSAPSPAFCDLCFWGENFLNVTGAGVPRLSKPERLVLSPHLYGPGTNSRMYYFNRTVFPNFPDNMGPIWTDHFLAPARAARAALLVGEWGGRYVGDDELWQDRFKAFLLENSLSSFYWALNPNSGDTGGILLEDWTAPHVEKQQMLSELPASSVAQALASVGPFECLKHVGAAQLEEEEDDVEEAEERRPVRVSPSVHEKRTRAGAREDTDEEDAVLLKGRAQQTSRPLAMAMDGMD